MFDCFRNSSQKSQVSPGVLVSPQATDQPAEKGEPTTTSQKIFRIAALSGSIALGPHALCLLGFGGLSVGGYALNRWCGHDGAADSSHGVEMRRLATVPTDYQEVLGEKADAARALLLEIEPRFQDIIKAKQAESPDEPIKMVFLVTEGEEVSVVVCKNGGLCPCSKPQVYEIGNRCDIAEQENFTGQHKLLHVLLGE